MAKKLLILIMICLVFFATAVSAGNAVFSRNYSFVRFGASDTYVSIDGQISYDGINSLSEYSDLTYNGSPAIWNLGVIKLSTHNPALILRLEFCNVADFSVLIEIIPSSTGGQLYLSGGLDGNNGVNQFVLLGGKSAEFRYVLSLKNQTLSQQNIDFNVNISPN